jgi:hypothetical protein
VSNPGTRPASGVGYELRAAGHVMARAFSGRVDALIAAGIVLFGTLIEWSRLLTVARNTLWAEDVRNFLANAVSMGSAQALFRPYAGYLHLVPRLIAGITVELFPVSLWANSEALISCLVAAGVSALVFICSRDVITWLPARALLALITLLVPLAPLEVLGNTANLHWYFLWLAPWLLLYRPRTRPGAWLLGIVALLAAMTEIQLVLFAPLLFASWRDRRRWPVAIPYLAGCAIQIAVTIFNPRGHSSVPLIGLPSLLYGYLINAAMSVWNSSPSGIRDILLHSGPWVAIAAIIPFLAAAAIVVRLGSRRQRQVAVLLLVSSLVLWCVAVELDPGARYDYVASANWQHIWLSRYGVVPSLMLLALVPLALTVLRRRYEVGEAVGSRWRLIRGIPLAIGLGTILVVLTSWMPTTTVRSVGPQWQSEVAAAQEACETAPPQTVMPLSGAPSPNWALELTCRQLQHDRL